MKHTLAALFGALGLASAVLAADLPPLPDIKADTARIGVSGLSSGAAMTTQLGVAYSDRVAAVGMMAGPPYLCALGASTTAVVSCLIMEVEWAGLPIVTFNLSKRDNVDLANLVAQTTKLAERKAIPDLSNIAMQRVWVSRGKLDAIVGPNATQAVRDFYTHFKAELAPAQTPDVPHTLPTDKPDLGACDGKTPDENYVSSCKLDDVGKMFGYLYSWPANERGTAKDENLKDFNQAPYTYSSSGKKKTPKALSMADSGRVYIPTACQKGGCKVHVAIHGCQQGKDTPFDLFTRKGGYNEWAENHQTVVLYPRVVATNELLGPKNPRGCWDWWGYTPDERIDWLGYAETNAPQMRSIMNMVDALAGKKPH